MKIIHLTVIVLLITLNLNAQIDIKTYNEKTDNGYVYYADNNEYCPVSIEVNFNLKNLRSTEGNGKTYVLPANTKRIELTKLEIIKKGKKYGYKSSSNYNYGDYRLKDYNKDYIYSLPYQKDEKYKVSQGYNGSFSHQNRKAIDFSMRKRTLITAARGGIVILALDSNYYGCKEEKCKKFNNKILIYHDDGTIATYVHIDKNGSLVKKGDIVEAGQVIAKSGNTGWSTAPHLHFEVYLPRIKDGETIPTPFKINNGDETELLMDKKEYTKNYD